MNILAIDLHTVPITHYKLSIQNRNVLWAFTISITLWNHYHCKKNISTAADVVLTSHKNWVNITILVNNTRQLYKKIQINTMRPLVTSTYLMLHTCCVSLVVLEARKSSQPYLGFYNPFPPRNDQILYNFASSPPSMSQGNSCNAKVLKHFPPKCSLYLRSLSDNFNN